MGSRRHAMHEKLSIELIDKPTPEILHTLHEIDVSAHSDPWSYDSLEACFTDNTRCFGLFINRELVGFSIISLVCDESELYTIGIKRQYQGLGFGHKLLRYTLEQCVAEGALTCYLEVRVSNEVAKYLYDLYGFTITGTRKKYYAATSKHPAEDAYTMACDLSIYNDGTLKFDESGKPILSSFGV